MLLTSTGSAWWAHHGPPRTVVPQCHDVRQPVYRGIEETRDLAGGPRRGFGSMRVRVTVGGSTWKTSIFPDSAWQLRAAHRTCCPHSRSPRRR
ncbi:DUF1905 domain-containing protein [Planotetraspora sp. GP83]|uniref:DUF1905 domain-containing protein n=1 Tax=Planotetraspora sp. GP83 TaxID=3156264 RepID=UPI0035121BB4